MPSQAESKMTLPTNGLEESEQLRARVIQSFEEQGFQIRQGRLVAPSPQHKGELRALHQAAVRHSVARSRPGLWRHEDRLLSHIAAGSDIVPEEIQPRLVLVQPRTDEELLFRYARLHWSIPVSAGYGRRIRFVVFDDSNDKLIGILGLGDPIFNLGPRDNWVGWNLEAKKNRLQSVMDLFVLGAVPPYSRLLCGKLIALLATSQEVQEVFHQKYGGKQSRISRRPLDGRLALLTTISALGRSSLYNRLRYNGSTVFQSLGTTRGSGDFHFGNGFYKDLRLFAERNCNATAKHPSWGSGFRNRRELIRKTLPYLGLSSRLMYHGIGREIFVAPLAENSAAFLRNDDHQLDCYERTTAKLFEFFRKRWLLPRASRDNRYQSFQPEEYRLWSP